MLKNPVVILVLVIIFLWTVGFLFNHVSVLAAMGFIAVVLYFLWKKFHDMLRF